MRPGAQLVTCSPVSVAWSMKEFTALIHRAGDDGFVLHVAHQDGKDVPSCIDEGLAELLIKFDEKVAEVPSILVRERCAIRKRAGLQIN